MANFPLTDTLIGFTRTLFLFKVTCHELRYLNRQTFCDTRYLLYWIATKVLFCISESPQQTRFNASRLDEFKNGLSGQHPTCRNSWPNARNIFTPINVLEDLYPHMVKGFKSMLRYVVLKCCEDRLDWALDVIFISNMDVWFHFVAYLYVTGKSYKRQWNVKTTGE